MSRFFIRCILILFFTGMQPAVEAQPLDGQGPLVVKIIEKNKSREIVFSRERLHALPLDSVRARSMPGTAPATWYGTSLPRLLALADVPLNQLYKLVISAPDGYVSVLSGSRLKAVQQGLLAYRMKEEKVFPEQFGGLRLIFPDQRAMYWVNSPSKMTVHMGKQDKSVRSMRFYTLKSPAAGGWRLKGTAGPRLSIEKLMMSLDAEADHFHVLTRDSLYREYNQGPLIGRMHLVAWEDGGWSIGGEAIPEGLKTLDIFMVEAGENVLLLKTLSETEAALWYDKVMAPLIDPYLTKEDCAVTVVKKDGYRHPSLLQRYWIHGEWTLARLIDEEYFRTDGLDFLEMTW